MERYYNAAHLGSAEIQVERLVQEAERLIASELAAHAALHSTLTMRGDRGERAIAASAPRPQHHAAAKEAPPLAAARRALDAAGGILAALPGGSGGAPLEVMVAGLCRNAGEADVRRFLDGDSGGGGGCSGVVRVVMRSDGDFLHPSDRGLVDGPLRAAGQNRTAVVTLRNAAALASALARDGAEAGGEDAGGSRRVSVRVLRAEPGAAKTSAEVAARAARLRVAHRAAEGRLRTLLGQLEAAGRAAVDAAVAAVGQGDGSAARAALARAERAVAALPPGDILPIAQVGIALSERPQPAIKQACKIAFTLRGGGGEKRMFGFLKWRKCGFLNICWLRCWPARRRLCGKRRSI